MKSQLSPLTTSSIFDFPELKYSYAAFGESKVTKEFSIGRKANTVTNITDKPAKTAYRICLRAVLDVFITAIEHTKKINPIINLMIIYIVLYPPVNCRSLP